MLDINTFGLHDIPHFLILPFYDVKFALFVRESAAVRSVHIFRKLPDRRIDACLIRRLTGYADMKPAFIRIPQNIIRIFQVFPSCTESLQ